MTTDLLCIAPHSDDAEIGIGGTLGLLADRGRTVWVCDLTRGELASNATPDDRWHEAQRAAGVLKLNGRVQLDLPDGFLAADDPGQTAAVVAVIRALRPRWIVTAPEAARHPDHVAAPVLVARAAFLAHLVTYRPAWASARWWPEAPAALADEAPPWTCEAVFATCAEQEQPSLVFDVSTTWARKLEALACFASQFTRGEGRRPTHINREDFLERVAARGRLWGHRAGVTWGEALRSVAVPVLADLPQERWS